MNDILFEIGFLRVEYLDLILISLLTVTGLLISRYISNSSATKKTKVKTSALNIIVWSSILLLIGLMVIPAIYEKEIIKNKLVDIKIYTFALITILFFVSTFLIKIVEKWLGESKNSKRNSNGFKWFVWFILAYFSAKLIFIDFNVISDFVIFTLKDTQVTVSNFIFVFTVLLFTASIIAVIKMALGKLVKVEELEKHSSVALLNISKYFIWTFSIIFSLQSIGFNLSLLLAGSAALLVGIGMGIQQLFNDFASGLILLFERQIKVGDYVETEDVVGKITQIGFRTTNMLTRDNVSIIIPNSKLVSNNVINWSNGEKYARFGLNIGVAYGSDVDKVKEILIKSAISNPEVLKNPPPEVLFHDFGNSSLDFKLFIYTENNFYNDRIKSEIRFEIYKEFAQFGIQIPFPQMDVHFPDKKTSD